MGGKNKYTEMFGSFTEPFNYTVAFLISDVYDFSSSIFGFLLSRQYYYFFCLCSM